MLLIFYILKMPSILNQASHRAICSLFNFRISIANCCQTLARIAMRFKNSCTFSVNHARLAILTIVISCRPTFLQNPIMYYNNFATQSKLFLTVTEPFQHFLLDSAQQSKALLSAFSLLCPLNSTATPISSPQGNPYNLKVIQQYAPAAVIDIKTAMGET